MTDCTIAEAELRGIITSIFKIAAPVIGDLLSREKLRGVAAGPGPSDAELRGLTDTIKSIFKTAAPVIVDLLSREKLRGVAAGPVPSDDELRGLMDTIKKLDAELRAGFSLGTPFGGLKVDW